ncbi:hypothetical protein BUALT_Bualt16G0070200 [Buddleja alternifolia]|uniref:Nuclear pore complex protein NUP1 n=1 Tax=Buddleja alternifolia TaxID=168488 RepID=A0AAV6WGB0_9LAMI|nr:hypothetical protein BUALT_Bualt16G0070200 [Buddleja alternifolia]
MNFFDRNLHKDNQSVMSRSTEERGGIRYDSEFSRIEELIKGNTFSREEIGYLMEILNSRVDNEWEKQKSSILAGEDAELVSLTPEIRRTPAEGKQQNIDRTMIDAFREASDVPVGVGASPIDIARAYMACRTSEGGHDLSSMSKGERTQPSSEFARKPLFPSPSPKPSICWPGSTVHDRLSYATPQSQRSRHRLYDFPRTPYSRTTLSKSTTKLQADRGYANTSTPFQQSQTSSIYGQVNLRGDTVDGYASVGPIRRIRNKFASEVRPRGSIFPSSPKDVPLKTLKPKVFGGYLSGTEKNLEPGETSGASKYWSGDNESGFSDRGIPNPNSSSSQAVRKILEHLDRNKPTPKEKEAEMKLATAWRGSSPSEISDSIREENTSSLHGGKHDSEKNTDIAGPNYPVKFNKGGSKSNYLVNFHDKGMDEAKDVVSGNAKASSAVFTGSSMNPAANAVPSFGIKGTSSPVVKKVHENALFTTNHKLRDTSLNFSRPHVNNGQDLKTLASATASDLSRNQGTKPSLPSISINKRDNGPGFTFPISTSSGALSEPPTPSITPSSSASILSQPVGGVPNVPCYSFGTNNSTPRLIFSFPSTSSASAYDDSDIKFSFGSDNKTRLSISSLGKDGICY